MRWTVRLLLFQALAGLFSFSLTMGETLETPQASGDGLFAGSGVDQASSVFMSPVSLVTMIFFMIWQYRLRVNYDRMGVRGMEYTPAMNVVWWFVPIANWFLPYKVLQELWRAGAAEVPEEGRRQTWRKAPPCPLIRTYWTIYLGTIAVGFVGSFAVMLLAFPSSSGSGMGSLPGIYLAIMLVTSMGQLAARFMEIFIVERLTKRQQAMHARLMAEKPPEDNAPRAALRP